MKKKGWVTMLIILAIVLFSGIVIYLNAKNAGEELVPREIAECIGNNAVMYSQTGCHFCKIQKDMFGSSVKYLKIIECDYQPAICNALNIPGTPTWIINGTQYTGVQPIETLQNATGCY